MHRSCFTDVFNLIRKENLLEDRVKEGSALGFLPVHDADDIRYAPLIPDISNLVFPGIGLVTSLQPLPHVAALG